MKTRIALLMLFGLLTCGIFGQADTDLNIEYEKYTLPNGLDVILHTDYSDPIVALAIRYHVGSNREQAGHTGFAHLFEHMMFQKSENVGEDQFFKLIQDAGGTLNGGTSNDATTYYEVVPKNALEKILWMESDRMGYMINTVTSKAFAIQQNVVQNEKRQSYDNQPYGFTQWVIAKNLYPAGHPYSWTVIGEMEDLKNATVDDVKSFHQKFYTPNNATLVLSGDFDIPTAKRLIEKYFGEIRSGSPVTDPAPVPVQLTATKKVFHEDNFARTAQIRIIWPTVEAYHPDAYALSYLGQLLSQGKKAPLYKILEKERKLTSSQYARNMSQEIAGIFTIGATANEKVNLNDIYDGTFDALKMFERDGFSDEDVERIKASLETEFYNGISSILGKSFQLASYNEDQGDPGFYKKEIELLRAVKKEDILKVYQKYIKDKPCLVTSFVPKGQLDFVVKGSEKAAVVEEKISEATQVEIKDEKEAPVVKTPASFDRSVIPVDGPDPVVTVPAIWQEKMKNGLSISGIIHKELPLVQFSLRIKGGHYLDPASKPGVANLMCDLMNEGTKNKTPLELEEAIERLGATINIMASNNSVEISGNTLTRNFDKVMELVREMLLEPRWDTAEFELAKIRIINSLKRQKANPTTLARNALNESVYGKGHVFSFDRQGTENAVATITIDDLKMYYKKFMSPAVAGFQVAGDIDKSQVLTALKPLETAWKTPAFDLPVYNLPAPLTTSKLIFVDVPGAKQSVINIGCLGLKRTDPDYFPATVMNYKLGGSFNGNVNLVLREEKGFTYGARTGFSASLFEPGTFNAGASVRSSATVESVQIFTDLMTKYKTTVSDEDLTFTRNSLMRGYARQFETLDAQVGMLSDINLYNLPVDYITKEQATIKNMKLDDLRALAQKYIDPSRMYYVIAGDGATQKEALEKLFVK
jgi:zinc protease